MLSIEGLRHYLLTIIDYFSRYIVAWAIVKTVSQREVKDLLAIAYINQGIVLDTDGSGFPIVKERRLSENRALMAMAEGGVSN